MRTTFKAAGIILLVLVSFVAGAITASVRGWGSELVFVRITNESPQEVLSVRLVHENGSIELKHLGPGKSRQARFVAAGESSYKIDAVLADGRSIQGGEAYVESGYHLTAVINEQGIESKHGSLY